MEATTDAPTVGMKADPARRLSEIEAAIANGDDDVVALLEEREIVKRQIAAEKIRKDKEAQAEYQRELEACSGEYQARLLPIDEQIADLWPRLVWALHLREQLEQESYTTRGADPTRNGIPFNVARSARDALTQIEIQAGIEFHVDFLGDSSRKNALPTRRAQSVLSFPTHVRDIHGNSLGGRYI